MGGFFGVEGLELGGGGGGLVFIRYEAFIWGWAFIRLLTVNICLNNFFTTAALAQ